ncbi:MAG: glycoside hydrolase family 3 C-terminal domain-containing protein [Anaerolineales bacterium]|nr:glycoside hydrolase family 3 C-terminal domain-containing protein [Anaerolineales bacterium]
MKKIPIFMFIISSLIILAGCQLTSPALPPPVEASAASAEEQDCPIYKDPAQHIEVRVEDLLARMSLDEKIGQMTQADHFGIPPKDVARYSVGSVLSGGGSLSSTNTIEEWQVQVKKYQDQALKTPLSIPLLFGVDSVHGFAHVNGAAIFPHNIGLGAARDPELVRRIGQAAAAEMRAAGILWNFAPTIAVPQDIRWGRTYEGFSEDTELVTQLGQAYIEGFQNFPAAFTPTAGQTIWAGTTAKHYLGDGGTDFGSSTQRMMGTRYLLDQGDMTYDEAAVRELFLPPYQAAVNAGAISVMASFSSWDGVKMHAHKYLITDVLKGELGFQGFVISDWGGIDQIDDDDYYTAVVTAINAGVDMNMVPYDYKGFIKVTKTAVLNGDIPQGRIDDAVRRILRAKLALGLFENPYGDASLKNIVGSEQHRQLARQAVRESLVLLKNDGDSLPIRKDIGAIYLAGRGADSVGMQCGGWTLTWQGDEGVKIRGGTSILEAINKTVSSETTVEYNRAGTFQGAAEVGIVVVGEAPYAEGLGDRKSLELKQEDIAAIQNTRAHVETLVVVLLSGRPMVITDQYPLAKAWVAAWLPGTEGAGITDVLFGDYPFTGALPYTWPRSDEQLPINMHTTGDRTGCQAPLFPFGYGLGETESTPIEWIACP